MFWGGIPPMPPSIPPGGMILMTTEDQRLAEQCEASLQTLARVDGWIRSNPEAVGSSGEALLRESGRLARALRKEAATAARKMCVGVFGPSQSGKSYLISALAQDADGSLLTSLGNESADFLQDINPAGGKESTGLVTRFTLGQSERPPLFPVKLRLLSELDIVKILVNTYYADCRHLTVPDEEALAARVDALARAVPPDAPWQAPFDENDMADLKDYVTRNFRAAAVVQKLESLYWPRAVRLAGRLAPEDRAALFELLWDEAKPFTALYLHLRTVLEALGHPDEAFCPTTALLPRERSIIDVATLRGLGQDGGDALEVATQDGRRVQASRAEVAALTAELTISMRHRPDDFFEHTDLLDFPGYRSRLKTDDVARELTKPDQLHEFFLRGKVAYLFERYKSDLELTSMLLCIGPSNQEVQDLPAVINEWVADAAGKTPELRRGRPITLFLVLTKFDMEFEKKKGALDDESRWSNRLHASLLDFLGKQHEWPERWTPEKPFDNVFWLRNPKFRWEAVISFDGERESGIRPEQAAYVEDMKAKCLKTPEVRRHFADPEAAWDAAFALNDGGVAYLRRHLRPVCEPAIKRRQVADRVADNLRPFVEHLRRFHRPDDKAALRERQRQLAMRLARSLALAAQNQRFGELLRAMLMRDHELYNLSYEVEDRLLREGPAPIPQASMGSAASAQDIMDDLFGDMAPPTEAPDGSPDGPEETAPPLDEAAAFAELVIDAWIERLNALAADPVCQTYFGLDADDFGHLTHELVRGLSRLGLEKDMARAVREVSGYRNLRRDRLVWRQASMAAYCVNAFVDWLGFNPATTSETRRTIQLAGRTRTLFAQKPDPDGYPVLPPEPLPFDRQYYTDWLAALVHLIEGNADFEGGQTFDPEQNARLGQLLDNLNPAAFAQDK